jgi:hypothetical protein
MSEKPMVVAATKKSEGGHGEYPVRYVVLKWFKWSKGLLVTKEYSRHMQVFDGVHEDLFKFGNYYCDVNDAIKDLVRTVEENNRDYPLGNISHIPGGMDFVDGDEVAA